MRGLFQGLGFVLTGMLVTAIFRYIQTSNKKAASKMNRQSFTMQYSKMALFLFAAASFLVLVFVLIFTLSGDYEYVGGAVIICSIGALAAICAVPYYFRFKVQILGDEIIFRPTFGKTKHYTFQDITYVREVRQVGVKILYCYSSTGKMFEADISYAGFELFVDRLKEAGVEFRT